MATRNGKASRTRGGKRRAAALAADAIPRAKIARELQKRITQLGLSRNDAAIAVGDAASQMSRLMTGHVTDFSADRLVKMLLRLGSDVDVVIRHGGAEERRRRQGRARVLYELRNGQRHVVA